MLKSGVGTQLFMSLEKFCELFGRLTDDGARIAAWILNRYRVAFEKIAKLTLKLKNLRQKDIPRTHHHAPLPVTAWRCVHSLAPCNPRVEEKCCRTRARDHADR